MRPLTGEERRAESSVTGWLSGARIRHGAITSVLLVGFVLLIESSSAGQSTKTVPRTSDGKPNLNGVWQVINTAAWDVQDHSAQSGVPAGQGIVEGKEIPYQPWAAAQKDANSKNRMTADPERKCYLPGVPRAMYAPFPFEIVQSQKWIAINFEYVHATRMIYTDGSRHPVALDFWMGDSRGRWEGDTLVVDVANFNGQTWFDRVGNFHSEALHLVERYTMTGPDHIRYEVTVEDPKVFTRPWRMSMPLYRRVDENVQLLEYECLEFTDPFGSEDKLK